MAATDTSIVIAVATGADTEVVQLDSLTGREEHRVRVAGVATSLALTPSPVGWLLYAEESVTCVDLATGRMTRFRLPGTLLDA
ncbi:hypothetical protein [Streptomyces flavalbus]|uniref:Uncharacterized protein n=1 Tax=Streptomyces flavalbus TaxID=2665155 RepID=A0ABW2WBI5_9ACTN